MFLLLPSLLAPLLPSVYCHLPFIDLSLFSRSHLPPPPKKTHTCLVRQNVKKHGQIYMFKTSNFSDDTNCPNSSPVHQRSPQSFPTFNPQGVHRAIEHDPVMVLGSTNAVVRPSPAHLRRAFVTNEITWARRPSTQIFAQKQKSNN